MLVKKLVLEELSVNIRFSQKCIGRKCFVLVIVPLN